MAAHGTKRTIQLCVATSATHPKGTLRALEGDAPTERGSADLVRDAVGKRQRQGYRVGQFLSGAQTADVYAHAHAQPLEPAGDADREHVDSGGGTPASP
jgi:hypothetical protein